MSTASRLNIAAFTISLTSIALSAYMMWPHPRVSVFVPPIVSNPVQAPASRAHSEWVQDWHEAAPRPVGPVARRQPCDPTVAGCALREDFIYSPPPAMPADDHIPLSSDHPPARSTHEGRTHVHKYFGCDPHCVLEDNSGRSMGECLEVLNTTSLKWPDRYCLRWMPRARR